MTSPNKQFGNISANAALILIPVITGLVAAYVGWLKWPDVLVDFGRELYVPWVLSKGHVLYVDVEYWNGPLSPYINALLFKLFGPSILTIELFNILLICAAGVFVYRFYNRGSRPSQAPLITASFLVLFAFAQFLWMGNYNFVTPYSHELTHGILIGFGAIWLLSAYSRHRRVWLMGLTGLFTGLALLTKVEVAVSVIAAVLLSISLLVWHERPKPGRLALISSSFITGLLLPILLFAAYFAFHLSSFSAALEKMFSSWLMMAGTGVSGGIFYKKVMGFDNLYLNLKLMGLSAAFYLVLAAPLVANHLVRDSRVARQYGAYISFALSALALWPLRNSIPWFEAFRALPLFMFTAALVLFVKAVRGRAPDLHRHISFFAMAVFAFMLLLKMVLNTHIYHYGFALAMPGALLLFYGLLSWAPSVMKKISGSAGVFYGSVMAVFTVMLLWHSGLSFELYSLKKTGCWQMA